MNLLGQTQNKITKDKNGKNLPHLEIIEVALVHCNIVNYDCLQDSRVLYTFVPNESFGILLETYPKNHVFSKRFNSEFQEIEIWFTDQNSQPFETEDLTLIIKKYSHYKGYTKVWILYKSLLIFIIC